MSEVKQGDTISRTNSSRIKPVDDDNSSYLVTKKETKKIEAWDRENDIDRDIPLTWKRFLISIVSYLLFLSDTFRTGLGYSQVDGVEVEPLRFKVYGPVPYPLVNITKNGNNEYTATEGTDEVNSTRVWSYKFDTTSVGYRGIIQHNPASPDYANKWPPCMTYQSECSSTLLDIPTTFNMIDSVVESVVKSSARKNTFDSITPDMEEHDAYNNSTDACHLKISQRLTSRWVDAFHHVISAPIYESVHARHILGFHYRFYPWNDLRRNELNLCNNKYRPPICDDIMHRFDPDSDDYELRNAANHISQRVKGIRQEHPESFLDLVIIQSILLKRSYVGSLATLIEGTGLEMNVLIRAQKCTTPTNCETYYVDDYRFESADIITDIAQWYKIIAILRGTAQAYNWIRLLFLFMGCYKFRQQEKKFHGKSNLNVFYSSMVTMLKIPSQVVIYGSWIPVVLYTMAYFIDSSMSTYKAESFFIQLGGTTDWPIPAMIQMLSIQMRNVWMIAFFVKLYVFFQTSGGWSPDRGIIGFKGNLISLVSCITICGQYRRLSYRDTRILNSFDAAISTEMISSESIGRAETDTIVSGFFLDIKLLLFAFGIYTGFMIFIKLLNYIRGVKNYHIYASTTYVPHTAGIFWGTAALSISWFGGLLDPTATSRLAGVTKLATEKLSMDQFIHKKCPERESINALINVTMITDPYHLSIIYMNGRDLYLYRSNQSGKQFHHPLPKHLMVKMIGCNSEDVELVDVTNTSEMSWYDLIYCY